MSLSFKLLADKHTKAAKWLIKFVKQKNYCECDKKEIDLLLLQLKANIILSKDWVPMYKEVEKFYQENFKRVLNQKENLGANL